MRQPLYNSRIGLLKYGIREIALVTDTIKKLNPSFVLNPENIGDPIKKGWDVPSFVKDIVAQEVQHNTESWGYVHSRGLMSARQFVVEDAKRCYPAATLTVDDVLFANGLGAAIGTLYAALPPTARVIGPAPSYPTHASLEAFSTGGERISYECDPNREWRIDMEHLESQLIAHPEVTGILVINPNNPTGAVYPKEDLEQVVLLAEKYNLFIIADEIYFRLVYNDHSFYHMSAVVNGRVPLIVMRGMSKDVPWPGSRCGWLEFHNTTLDEEFATYVAAIKQRMLLEVCATSLPQWVLPQVYTHAEYPAHLSAYIQKLEENSNTIAAILGNVPGVTCNRTNGAFYMMVVFEDGLLHQHQTLPIRHAGIQSFIEQEVVKPSMALDKRFVYYVLAHTGIVVTPASDFYTKQYGFRITTLERDEETLQRTYTRLAQAIQDYTRV